VHVLIVAAGRRGSGIDAPVDFYRGEADRQGGRVLELGSGTGHKMIPIASDGHPCTGLELSPDMLAEARRKTDERALAVEWVQGDMRDFDLGRTFVSWPMQTVCDAPAMRCRSSIPIAAGCG
jgi:SAM-dependent methyltransferase